jgi:hypothetical protein
VVARGSSKVISFAYWSVVSKSQPCLVFRLELPELGSSEDTADVHRKEIIFCYSHSAEGKWTGLFGCGIRAAIPLDILSWSKRISHLVACFSLRYVQHLLGL